jgi:hypothetical protein
MTDTLLEAKRGPPTFNGFLYWRDASHVVSSGSHGQVAESFTTRRHLCLGSRREEIALEKGW